MNEIYNDPSAPGRTVSSCSAPIPLEFGGLVVLLTNEAKPALVSCIHKAWLVDETEVNEMREFVNSEMK